MNAVQTTENVPLHRRAAYWEAMVSQQFVPAHCVPARRAPFSARIRSLDLDVLVLSEVGSEGTEVVRTARHVSHSERDYFLVSLQIDGTGRLVQAGRSVTLTAGDMVLYDTSRVYALSFAAAQRQLVLRIPRAEVLARSPNAESLVAISVPAAVPAATLARDIAHQGASPAALAALGGRTALGSTLLDLVLDGLSRHDRQRSSRTGAARLADAQRIARLRMTDPDFSVATWAGSMGVSERYLRLLFSRSTASPSQYLWGQRLARAAAALRDRGQRNRSLTDIAHCCGFSDSAHFSRVFRATYGITPRDYRSRPPGQHPAEVCRIPRP